MKQSSCMSISEYREPGFEPQYDLPFAWLMTSGPHFLVTAKRNMCMLKGRGQNVSIEAMRTFECGRYGTTGVYERCQQCRAQVCLKSIRNLVYYMYSVYNMIRVVTVINAGIEDSGIVLLSMNPEILLSHARTFRRNNTLTQLSARSSSRDI